jgi:hypothetical protein
MWPRGTAPFHGATLGGANGRIRTDDLIITNDLLCQLSYVGVPTIPAILWAIPLKSRTCPYSEVTRRSSPPAAPHSPTHVNTMLFDSNFNISNVKFRTVF